MEHSVSSRPSFPRWGKEVLDGVASALNEKGYFVVDAMMEDGTLTSIHGELKKIYDEEKMLPEMSVKVLEDGEKLPLTEAAFRAVLLEPPESPDADEVLLSMTQVTRKYMKFIAATLVVGLNQRIEGLSLYASTQHNKLASSCGGAELPKHMDNDGTDPEDNRMLTVLLYLNPGWKESHHGELELFLLDGTSGKIVKIMPKHGRIAGFWSDTMVHRVSRVNAEYSQPRMTVTLWIPTKDKERIHANKEVWKQIIYTHFSEYLRS